MPIRLRALTAATAFWALGWLWAATLPAQAAAITVDASEDMAVIVAEGRIVAGDAARFRQLVRANPGREIVLIVSSEGGDVFEAEEWASWISRWRITVIVGPHAPCASACFLLLAASPARFAYRTSQIGIHSAAQRGRETVDSLAVTTLLARDAREYGVPASIIGRMVTTPPGEMAWLGEAEMRAMRITFAEDIAARTNRPANPPPSPQSAPPPIASPPSAPPALSGPAPTASLEPGASFQRGRAERQAWESWIASLSGSMRGGAEWWASQRSLPRPGGCESQDAAFSAGCLEARRRLSPSDASRRADPEYRRGWNSL